MVAFGGLLMQASPFHHKIISRLFNKQMRNTFYNTIYFNKHSHYSSAQLTKTLLSQRACNLSYKSSQEEIAKWREVYVVRIAQLSI